MGATQDRSEAERLSELQDQPRGLLGLIPDCNQFSGSAKVPVSPGPHVDSHSIAPTTSARRLPTIRLDAGNNVVFGSSSVTRLISTGAEANVVGLVANGVGAVSDDNLEPACRAGTDLTTGVTRSS